MSKFLQLFETSVPSIMFNLSYYTKTNFSPRVSYVSNVRLTGIIAVSSIFKKQLILKFSLAISIDSTIS